MMKHWIAALVLAAAPQAAIACTPNPDPDLRPWKEKVAGGKMFIGTVVEIRGEDGTVWTVEPKCETMGATKECEAFFYGMATVVFDVEVPINADYGPTFEVEQGRGMDCRIEFRLGQRWLYIGNFNDSPSMYLNQSYDYEQAHPTAN